MRTKSVTIPHKLSQKEAFRRIRLQVEEMKLERAPHLLDLKEGWGSTLGVFCFTTQDIQGSATVGITDRYAHITWTLPNDTEAFDPLIESEVRSKLMCALTQDIREEAPRIAPPSAPRSVRPAREHAEAQRAPAPARNETTVAVTGKDSLKAALEHMIQVRDA